MIHKPFLRQTIVNEDQVCRYRYVYKKNRGFGSNYGGYNIWRWNLKKSILELREGHAVAAHQATRYKGGTDGGKGWFIRLASRVFIAAKIHHAYTKKNDYSFFRCLNAHIRYFNVSETTVSMGRIKLYRVVTRNVWSDGSNIGTALLGIKFM